MSKILGLILRPVVITVAALLLLTIVVFFGGRMLREKDYLGGFPSDAFLGIFIAAIWIVAAIVWAYRVQQARRRARIIEERLRAQAHEQVASVRPDRKPEIEALEKQFEEALAALQTSRMGKSALYALPWYIIVGPPGSGKTTLLKESNLNFPTMGQGGRGVRGVGGTRNCDWWFTDTGILLDTAGRYTTEAEDHDEWIAFLDMLKKARKHKPINGAIVAISVQDIVGATEEQLVEHSQKIRDRLAELTNELDMVFPIYLVFTKCDLLDGFVETFGSMTRDERAQVWGTTLTPELVENRSTPQIVGEQFDELYRRLCANRLSMLAVDRPSAARQRIYSFPLQFDAVRDAVVEFVGQLNQPNPYYEGAALRGVYFTSGTQEGTPIDRVLSAMGEAFGLEEDAESRVADEGTAKSYFIDDLFTKVVFRDKDVAQRSEKVVRQKALIRKVGVFGSAAVLAVLFVMLLVGYFGNSSVIGDVQHLLGRGETLVKDPDQAPTKSEIAVLDDLRARFVDLHESHYLNNFLLGRDTKLYYIVRTRYVEALKDYFLLPITRYLDGYLAAVIRQKKKLDDRELTSFSTRLSLYAMLGGKDPATPEDVLRVLEEENLWSWDPARIGQKAEVGRKPADRSHLEAFVRIVEGEKNDWLLDIDEGVLRDARQHLIDANKAYRAVESVTAKPEAFKTLDAARQSAVTKLEGWQGTEADVDQAKKLIDKKWVAQARQRLGETKPDERDFRTLKLAQAALPKYTGEGSIYITAYEEARSRVAEANALTDPTGDVDAKVDREWLQLCLRTIGTLDEALAKFMSGNSAGGLVLPDLLEKGERVEELLRAFEDARQKVELKVQRNAEPQLRSESATALTGLIGAIERAFAREAIVELEAHWAGTRTQLLQFKTKFPFDPKGEQDVPVDTFGGMFGVDGTIQSKLAPMRRLTRMRVNGQPLVAFTNDFEGDLERFQQIREGMFADENKALKVPIKLILDVGASVGEVVLFLGTDKDISSKRHPKTRRKFGGHPCEWVQSDVGARVEIRVADEKQTSLPMDRLHGDRVPNTPWRLLRVLQAGQVESKGKAVTCRWTFEYRVEGSPPQPRSATAEFITPGPNPFAPRFFEEFSLTKNVFEDR